MSILEQNVFTAVEAALLNSECASEETVRAGLRAVIKFAINDDCELEWLQEMLEEEYPLVEEELAGDG